MAIYRPPKARWPLAVAAGVVGILVGLLISLAFRSEPSPADVAADVRAELAAAAGSLEVVAIEYDESVVDGEVTKDAEYRGAVSALASSRDRYENVAAAVEALAPDRATAIEDAYDEAESQMSDHVPTEELTATLDEIEALLTGAES